MRVYYGIKSFDGKPAIVANLIQCCHNRLKGHVAHARAKAVGIIDMNMTDSIPNKPNLIGHRARIMSHGLDIDHQTEPGPSYLFHKLDSLINAGE